MNDRFSWWNLLQHGGLLLDSQRLSELLPDDPPPLSAYDQDRLRRRLTRFQNDPDKRGEWITLVLEAVCGFTRPQGEWYRGGDVSSRWTRRAMTGEAIRPRQIWLGPHGAVLPVFVEDHPRLGIGRGRRGLSHVLQWLRQDREQLALLTNGQQWRLVFAGMDYDAFCQWDADSWFSEGDVAPELTGFRALFAPRLWVPDQSDQPCRLLQAINDSRKGQADLSQVLGERVRQAAERLIEAHAPVLRDAADPSPPDALNPPDSPHDLDHDSPPTLSHQDIYRAAVRMIMRLVVVLFAESREGLLARDNPVFHQSYSLQGLREQLERLRALQLASSFAAYPRILALIRLIREGSSHPDLPVPAYGGELFAPGDPRHRDGMKRALHRFENACFQTDVMNDHQVWQILDLLTRTQVRIRQGRSSFRVSTPVDFSSLDSEYIGILYEGLLDFELRCAGQDEPIVFLAVGDQPALPLSTLERMDDRAIKNLLERLKDTTSSKEETEEEEEPEVDAEDEDETDATEDAEQSEGEEPPDGDQIQEDSATEDLRYTLKSRAEGWARRACEIGGLVRKPAGRNTPEKTMQYERALDAKARQLVVRVVLPGHWYLVRWGGTRKGSGTFYTPPLLAIPTVHRTLRPLAYDPPLDRDGQPQWDAPGERWTPQRPEQILERKVCDPACGSGSFPLAALRFLTTALYDSLFVHDRIRDHGGRAVLQLIYDETLNGEEEVAGGRWPVAGGEEEVACGRWPVAGEEEEVAGEEEEVAGGRRSVAGGEEVVVAEDGKGVEHGDAVRGPGGVAAGDGLGEPGLSGNATVSPGRTLRTDQSDSASGGVRSVEYRRGARSAVDQGVPESSGDRERIPVRGGDAAEDCHATGLPDPRADASHNSLSGHRPPATDHLPLASEALPCRPDDDDFEPRTKAILRRYVVERCIYGVDLDPLAVELCRLSLWIETLDPALPLTFLNHKIKCGNSLVGTWFDQFLHYPAMAWEREAGDKAHTNGVHFDKEDGTRAIKELQHAVRADLIDLIDGGRFQAMYPIELDHVRSGHDAAEAALAEIHRMGITEVERRAVCYQQLRDSEPFQRLQAAFDLWCALWFWPADQLEHAPLPLEFVAGQIDSNARQVVQQLAQQQRFFHWELEFPDVFNASQHGFDAILGNPPWDIAKPNSKEFFSAFDPLYRTYGKQEAIRRQTELFRDTPEIEHQWLDYCAGFKAMGNWVKHAGFAFGDRVTTNRQGKSSHGFNLGDRGRGSFASSQRRHDRWRAKRQEATAYADAEHSFRHQGSADINLYKLFLEQAHALLRTPGPDQASAARLGLIVPSGLYSDFGTGDLRRLFVDHCRWEWLFGFENREGIFNIHRSYKFNPVIVAKGGRTDAIRTAFMRRRLADWERAEPLVIAYSREQVVQFSPKSRAILEIQSQRDLDVLTKIYAHSVLLGDDSEQGWGIRYATEFHMTNDSKLFPPRPTWEAWGYRPDEYSRWIKGPWLPIADLWDALGIDPERPVPLDRQCQRRIADGLARGEVAATDRRVRCAQPPYDRLPIPRADIPEGIILSREADAWLVEDQIPEVTFTDARGKPLTVKVVNDDGRKEEIEITGPAVALPLYEGRMIGQFDFSEKGWVSGKGRSAEWRMVPWGKKQLEPQYLMGNRTYVSVTDIEGKPKALRGLKLGFMGVGSATNSRSMIAGIIRDLPCGNAVPPLQPKSREYTPTLGVVLDSFAFDFVMRCRLVGLNLNYFVIAETPLPNPAATNAIGVTGVARSVLLGNQLFSDIWLRFRDRSVWRQRWAVSDSERIRVMVAANAIAFAIFGVQLHDAHHILSNCDFPLPIWSNDLAYLLPPKGFWRVDKSKPPEQRQTVLSLIAFHDLESKIAACGGDVERGIAAFCEQNDGQGWMLPETLRLADYGLGHDDRARQHQPVRECFGPRFYDWQLVQTPEESWRECHLHARNLLGPRAYQKLLDQLENPNAPTEPTPSPPTRKRSTTTIRQQNLFEED